MYTFQHYRKGIVIIVFVLVIVATCYTVLSSYRSVQSAYASFLVAEERHMTSAVIPSIDQNPIRRQLNQALAEALSESASTAERLTRAERGVNLLKDAERQIDMTMTTRDALIDAIANVRSEDSLFSRLLHDHDIVRVTALAEQQMEIVNDIRGLSYRANFHTGQIFEQLITDGGHLTPAHVTMLNELIPKVEEQFDQRANLYGELEALHDEIVE